MTPKTEASAHIGLLLDIDGRFYTGLFIVYYN